MGLSQLMGLIAALLAGLAGHSGPRIGGPARGLATPRAAASVCRNEGNARRIRATGLTCAVADSAIQTYEGAPTGCLSGARCVQSGLAGRSPIIVDCTRNRRAVTCLVYLKDSHGSVHDPRIGGVRVPGRFHRGTVSFRMRRSPRH
jgi:hypothetical protein